MSEYYRKLTSEFLQMYFIRYPLEDGADNPTGMTEDIKKNA
jgi:hypothetical protein